MKGRFFLENCECSCSGTMALWAVKVVNSFAKWLLIGGDNEKVSYIPHSIGSEIRNSGKTGVIRKSEKYFCSQKE